MIKFDLTPYLAQISKHEISSNKGDNGRVLVIGGSRLFHAASFWSASMAAHLVDMVHFSSPVMENNELMRVRAKSKFWDGIVVPYEEIEHYIEEDDAILIGPGMERGKITREIINKLLKKYPDKKWIVDGGALQEVDPTLLTEHMIITPNQKELSLLNSKFVIRNSPLPCSILSKGPSDTISSHTDSLTITGGSPGLTKGGTGDVLAGLVLGLAAKSPSCPSCVISSYTLKLASEELEKSMGPYFAPSDLIRQIPHTLNSILTN